VNRNSDIQFISVTIDNENCGWEAIKGVANAFEAVRFKSLFPIFNFTFINNSEKTILLTNIELKNEDFLLGYQVQQLKSLQFLDLQSNTKLDCLKIVKL